MQDCPKQGLRIVEARDEKARVQHTFCNISCVFQREVLERCSHIVFIHFVHPPLGNTAVKERGGRQLWLLLTFDELRRSIIALLRLVCWALCRARPHAAPLGVLSIRRVWNYWT